MPRRTAVASLLLLAIGCAAPAPDPGSPDGGAERAAIEAAITEWFDAGIAQGDTALVRQALAPGFAILEDSVWYDRDGFVAFVASLPQLVGGPFTLRYQLSDWRTTVRGDVAWTSFVNRAVLRPERGDSLLLHWRETVVLVKDAGRWLIDRYHSAPAR